MTDADDRTARAWIRLQQNWWAHGELFTACTDHPRKAWRLLCRIEDLATTRELIRDLGAGPLEDFLHLHAPAFIRQIERRAEQRPRFRRALQSARIPQSEDPVSQRLFALGVEAVAVTPEAWQAAQRADGAG